MDEFKWLSDLGMAGAVITVLIIQVRYLQTKLVNVIESNTKAMAELKSMIERCATLHQPRGGRG